jgi:hypothetical protein
MAMRENGPFPGQPGRDGDIDQAQGTGHDPAMGATRIGDAERDVRAQELGEHYAAGRLTLDELHDRLGLVLSARTRDDLSRVMADLPGPRRPVPRQPSPAQPGSQAAPARPAPDALQPALAASSRRHDERSAGDTVSRVAAAALLLLAMLIWLLTVLLFTAHG